MPRGKLSQDLGRLDPAGPRYATDVVEHVLAQARAAEASDVHLHPGADGLEVRWRIDGMLQPVAVLPSRLAANVAARLKVLAELLTYRTDVPQEGRIRGAPGEVEMRLSTFPTLHGEKAVVRLFAGSGRLCAVKRCWDFSGCNSHPATGSLQPVAIGAAVEETKPSEPSRQMCRLGDAASRQAVTRVNVEQASKRPMWTPTLQSDGEGRRRWG